jgi:hypothetical protein
MTAPAGLGVQIVLDRGKIFQVLDVIGETQAAQKMSGRRKSLIDRLLGNLDREAPTGLSTASVDDLQHAARQATTRHDPAHANENPRAVPSDFVPEPAPILACPSGSRRSS